MIDEPISEVLLIAGIPLTFTGFELQGIPGFEISTLYKGEQSYYEVTKQDFNFQVESVEVVTNSITTDMVFTITDSAYVHTFKVSRPVVADLTGWSVLYADYQGKVNV